MEEPPLQRGEKLIKYTVIIALAVLVVIGVLIVWGQANDPCNNCTGEGCGGAPPCMQNIKNAL